MKILSTRRLTAINQRTPPEGRRIASDVLAKLDPRGTHVLDQFMAGEAGLVRVSGMLKIIGAEVPVELVFDMDYSEYRSLTDAPA